MYREWLNGGRSDRNGSEVFVSVGQETRGLVGERGLKSWSWKVRHDWYIGSGSMVDRSDGNGSGAFVSVGQENRELVGERRGLMGWSGRGKGKGRVKSAFWHVPDECVMRSDLNFRVRS